MVSFNNLKNIGFKVKISKLFFDSKMWFPTLFVSKNLRYLEVIWSNNLKISQVFGNKQGRKSHLRIKKQLRNLYFKTNVLQIVEWNHDHPSAENTCGHVDVCPKVSDTCNDMQCWQLVFQLHVTLVPTKIKKTWLRPIEIWLRPLLALYVLNVNWSKPLHCFQWMWLRFTANSTNVT